ncbi:MAG: hypothetical protein JW774_00335, partial [Candidatus Aureabacteria bacterium]|nr:hypothetical protein [Candidatus Auribacterota bacterium]
VIAQAISSMNSIEGMDNGFNFQQIEASVLQGMAQGAFQDWLQQMAEDGRINDEWKSFLDGMGGEILNEIDYVKMAGVLNNAVQNFGDKLLSATKWLVNSAGEVVGIVFRDKETGKLIYEDMMKNRKELKPGENVMMADELKQGMHLEANTMSFLSWMGQILSPLSVLDANGDDVLSVIPLSGGKAKIRIFNEDGTSTIFEADKVSYVKDGDKIIGVSMRNKDQSVFYSLNKQTGEYESMIVNSPVAVANVNDKTGEIEGAVFMGNNGHVFYQMPDGSIEQSDDLSHFSRLHVPLESLKEFTSEVYKAVVTGRIVLTGEQIHQFFGNFVKPNYTIKNAVEQTDEYKVYRALNLYQKADRESLDMEPAKRGEALARAMDELKFAVRDLPISLIMEFENNSMVPNPLLDKVCKALDGIEKNLKVIGLDYATLTLNQLEGAKQSFMKIDNMVSSLKEIGVNKHIGLDIVYQLSPNFLNGDVSTFITYANQYFLKDISNTIYKTEKYTIQSIPTINSNGEIENKYFLLDYSGIDSQIVSIPKAAEITSMIDYSKSGKLILKATEIVQEGSKVTVRENYYSVEEFMQAYHLNGGYMSTLNREKISSTEQNSIIVTGADVLKNVGDITSKAGVCIFWVPKIGQELGGVLMAIGSGASIVGSGVKTFKEMMDSGLFTGKVNGIDIDDLPDGAVYERTYNLENATDFVVESMDEVVGTAFKNKIGPVGEWVSEVVLNKYSDTLKYPDGTVTSINLDHSWMQTHYDFKTNNYYYEWHVQMNDGTSQTVYLMPQQGEEWK